MKIPKSFTSLCLAAALCACTAVSASAAVTVSDGNFEYLYTDDAWTLHKYIGSQTEVTLPSEFGGSPVTEISAYCFSQTDVTAVTVPDSYHTIGSYAFYACESLQTVSLPASLNALGTGAFYDSGLREADLSSTKLDAVSNRLFYGCKSLSAVSLPPTVSKIGDMAFYESGLTEIVLPDGVTSVGDSCFENSAVRSVALPESLQTVGDSAFRGAEELSELYLPDGIGSIGAYALYPMSVRGSIHVDCFKDSFAAAYCYENFVSNVSEYAKLFGDANLDGTVNVNDVTELQRYCAEYLRFNRPAQLLADVTHDQTVQIDDATTIQLYLSEFISTL